MADYFKKNTKIPLTNGGAAIVQDRLGVTREKNEPVEATSSGHKRR